MLSVIPSSTVVRVRIGTDDGAIIETRRPLCMPLTQRFSFLGPLKNNFGQPHYTSLYSTHYSIHTTIHTYRGTVQPLIKT